MALPAPEGIAFPYPTEAITPENAHRVVELARWGKGPITDLAVSPDGSLLAVASSYGVYLYEPITLTQLHFFETSLWMKSIAVSPDNQHLVAGGEDGSIWIWNIPERALIRSFRPHQTTVLALAFSPDGKFFV